MSKVTMGKLYSLSAEEKEFSQLIIKLLNDADIKVPSKHIFRLLHQIPKFYPSFPKAGTFDMRVWDKIGERFYVATSHHCNIT